MNSRAWIVLATVAVIVLAANLIPLRRGVWQRCSEANVKPSRRAVVLGLPIAFYTTTDDNGCLLGDTQERHDFAPAGVWFDLIAAGAILTGTFMILEGWGTRR